MRDLYPYHKIKIERKPYVLCQQTSHFIKEDEYVETHKWGFRAPRQSSVRGSFWPTFS